MKDPAGEPDLIAFSLADKWFGSEWTDDAGMNDHEQEEYLLIYGTREERKAIQERRKALKHGGDVPTD
jgi:hypothetical protein